MARWKCARCGQYHDDVPLAYGLGAPAYHMNIPPERWADRVDLTDEACVVDGEHFFVRGLIRLPIRDAAADAGLAADHFEWIVWISLSKQNMRRMAEVWDTPGREREPPYFGWLCSEIPFYPSTLHLKTRVHTRPIGELPWIELEPTDHPLAVEQREGITVRRIIEIAESALHPS